MARRCLAVEGLRSELDLAGQAGLVDTADVYEDAVGRWDASRVSLHEGIVQVLVPIEQRTNQPRRAYLLSGAPGAGKTTVLTRMVHAHRRHVGDAAQPLATISADDVKALLPEYRNGLGSVVVHMEACHIAYELAYPAILASDADVVIDSIGRAEHVARWARELSGKRFEVHVLAVTCEPEQAVARMRHRALETHRLVPSDVVREACEEAVRTIALARDDGLPCHSWVLVDNSGDQGGVPIVEAGSALWGSPHGPLELW